MRFVRSCGRTLIEGAVGGRCEFRHQPTNARHSHAYFEVCLALSGRGTYHHGGREWALASGDLFLAEPGVVHEISSWTSRDLELFFVSLVLRRAGAPLGGAEEAIAGGFEARREIHRPGCAALAAYVPLILRPEGVLPSAAAGLFALEAMALLGGRGDEDREDESLSAVLNRSRDVAEAAGALGVSTRTLQRRAHAAFGHGAREEIERRAMNRAAHRLLMGYGVGETAVWLGEDPDSFARRFRRVQGLSPQRYQRHFAPPSGSEGATDHSVPSSHKGR